MKRILCAALAVMITLAALAFAFAQTVAAEDNSASGEARYAKKKIYLFAKKSTSSKKLCQIAKGDKMTFIEASGTWANVTYETDGGEEYTGFVKKSNISKTKVGTDPTPTPEATPTPTPEPTDDPDATPTPMPSPSAAPNPVRPGGGGRPSGSGGSSSSSGEQSAADQLGITPGKALTGDHASGSYTSVLYGAVGLKVSSKEMTQLTVDSKALDITLSRGDEGAGFTAKFNSDGETETLTLTPAAFSENMTWHLGGSAIVTLAKSGVDALVLEMDENNYARVATSELFSGVAYDALRASGVPESGIGLDIDAVSPEFTAYAVTDAGRRELPQTDDKVFYARGLEFICASDNQNAEG